jgi:site-specific recombinase XerD
MKQLIPHQSHHFEARMGWQRNYVTLNTGERVRYSLLQRPDDATYFVRFRSIHKSGRLERSTGCVKKVDAIEAAHQIILEEHGQVAPLAERMDWKEAKAKLKEAMEADGKRPRTIQGYNETLRRLIEMFPLAKGPADITDRMAADFKRKYAGGSFSRMPKKEGEHVPLYARKLKSLDSRIRTLKAIFGWFERLGLVNANPFAEVEQPELDKHEVKYVRQSDLAEFLEWLEGRYPGWRMPHLFFNAKALTGCRLEDICGLHSEQLQEGRLVFEADQTKNRSERYAILPKELYAELEDYKGDTFLWERYPTELRLHTKSTSRHQVIEEFSARRLYGWIVALLRDYQRQTGNDLSSHDFRRAAFTRAAERDIHPKRAAVAFDVTPETMLRYYTATEKKKTADEVLSGLATDLMPKKQQALKNGGEMAGSC